MNSRALSAIFNSIGEEQFKLVQGFNTAKEAWDELQRYYEGTTSVRRSRLDSLASKFENLRMEKDEKVTTFSAKISAIANEASVLGKKYKDKKLVKKFLRCLPEKFSAHKSAMTVSLDTDTMSFGEVVGMMKAHEMELEPQVSITQKGVAFAAATSENPRLDALERSINKLAKNIEFQNRSDRGKWKARGREAEKSTRNEKRCFECHGIGHFQGDCPTIKLRDTRCSECNGLGHAKDNCVSMRGGKDKSYVGISSEAESESEEEEDNQAGFCAFPAIICSASESEGESDIEDNKIEVSAKVAEVVSKTHSDSEDEDEPLEYEDLARQLIELTKETIELIKEKEVMKEELRKEKEKSTLMEQELFETKKKIQMLNSTKDLEKILSMGRTEKANYGLGYGGETTSSNANVIQSVSRNTSQDVPANQSVRRNTSRDVPANQYVRRNTSQFVPTMFQNRAIERRTSYGCYYCGKHGHIKRHCYSFKAKVRYLMNQQRFYPNYRDVSYVYMRNEDLYNMEGKATKYDHFELKRHEHKLQQDSIKKYGKGYLSQAESEFLNELCQTRRGREVLDEGGSFISN